MLLILILLNAMAEASLVVTKGKGKGAPPPPPKNVSKPPSASAYTGPTVKVSDGELKSVGATVVTSVDGTKRIEHANGTVETIAPKGKLHRVAFEDLPALSALVKEHSKLLPCARSFSQGIPTSGLERRLEDDFGDELKNAFIAAAGEHWSDVQLDSDKPYHGRLGNAAWPLPAVAAECDDLARPGYRGGLAHEYLDSEEVLRAKVALLADMLRNAKHAVVYGGAGLSTASGIADYATRTGASGVAGQELAAKQATGKSKGKGKGNISTAVSSFAVAKPNFGHRTIAALTDKGLIWRFVQQNHDGLPQKAGVPQGVMNEIHGAVFDPSNPVVKMQGNLRNDLFKDMLLCERKADLVLTLGSSLAGMNADRLVQTCSERASASPLVHGSVIVSLQTTPHDKNSSVRIYATIDRTMELLAECLALDVPPEGKALPQLSADSRPLGADVDVFDVPYDEQGKRLAEGLPRQRWDLRERSIHTVTDGPNKGARAIILGKNDEGHFRVGIKLNPKFQGDYEDIRLMGSWWINSAVAGDVASLPIVNRREELTADPE